MGKRLIRISVLLLVVLLIVACTGSLIADLFLSDVYELTSDTDLVYLTSATIEIESYSDEEDEELYSKISEWFRGASNFRYEVRDFSTFLLVDIKVPIINVENENFDSSRDLITLFIESDYMGTAFLGFRFSEEVFNTMNDYLLSHYLVPLSTKEWRFTVNLYNDTSAMRTLRLEGVYADGKPLLYPTVHTLEPYDSVAITFPDILRDYALEGEDGYFAAVY